MPDQDADQLARHAEQSSGQRPRLGRLADLLARNPDLARAIGGVCAAARQDGLSNEVFRVDGGNGSFILRLERTGQQGRVDRAQEEAFARRAAALGLGPEVVCCDPAQGFMLLRALPGARPLAQGDAADLAEATQLGVALRRLHSDQLLRGAELDPVALITVQRSRLRREALPISQAAVIDGAIEVARALQADAVARVPSHCDLVPQNVLLSGGRLWLIDFEYAACADPAWDLAYAGLEADYAAPARMALLSAYCAGDFPAAAKLALRVGRMRPICDVVSALWAMEQAQQGNPATDFAAYAEQRFRRAEAGLKVAASCSAGPSGID